MNQNLLTNLLIKWREAVLSVLPIAAIVLILHFTIAPMPTGTLGLFLIGTVLLVFGMGLFTLGADLAMMPMGEQIGSQLLRSKKLWLLILVSLAIGVMITIAEPDLQVLAEQVPSVPNLVLILSVAFGVGIFLVVSLLRVIFQIRLSYLLLGLYAIVFGIAFFIPGDYLSVAFDSGGVTTGPITVPFILALGVGVSAIRGGKSSHDDSFGLVALCSIGPILAVMITGLFFDPSSTGYTTEVSAQVSGMREVLLRFAHGLPEYFQEVAMALLPIILFFLVFQLVALKLPKSQIIKMTVGVIYTFGGLVLFLTGVNVGFMPVGRFLGETIGNLPFNWILIPLGMLMGFVIVAAEPAVHVLNDQVEEITGGAISKRTMLAGLACGVALSIGLAMLRVLTGLSIWYMILPGYLLALSLTFLVPRIFTAIAFDSGGVASGPMTATFLLPLTMGACEAVGGNILTDAFGVVAMVAMTPLLTIQIIGLVYQFKIKRTEHKETDKILDPQWFSQVGAEWLTQVRSDWLAMEQARLLADLNTDNCFIDLEELHAMKNETLSRS